jgi:hypothetical protein
MFPVRYELGFYNPENVIVYSNRRGNIKSYMDRLCVYQKPDRLVFSTTYMNITNLIGEVLIYLLYSQN